MIRFLPKGQLQLKWNMSSFIPKTILSGSDLTHESTQLMVIATLHVVLTRE